MGSINNFPWVQSSYKLLVSPTSQRLRTQRRVCILFAFILLVSSGSLLVLHLTADQFTRSQDPYSSTSSSSSIVRWTSNTMKNNSHSHKKIITSIQVEEEKEEKNDDNNDHESHARPRHALPRRRPISEDRELNLMRQQLELQEGQLKNLRQHFLGRQKELVSPQLNQQRQTPEEEPQQQQDSSITDNKQQQQQLMSPRLNMESTNNTIRESALSPGPFEETLDKNSQTNYLTYLPYAGISNQFYGMLRGMEVAKALDRTLIIPPITSSSHDKSKQNQPWSKFFDLEQFSKITGVKVVEVHELRDAELTLFNEMKCHITCGFGSKRTIDFTAKGFLRQWRLNATLTPLSTDDSKLETILRKLMPFKDNKYLCLSNTYKIAVKDKSEWERFGQHLHFTRDLRDFVQRFLDQSLIDPSESNSELKDKAIGSPRHRYITIHARRGDFAKYCEGNFAGPKLVHCLPSTDQISHRVDSIQARLNPSLNPSKRLPVFVATNERDQEELKRFANLGWQYLDHDKMKTSQVLGVFGPMMVDQMLMAQAEAMIGIQMSTFSRVGALRQRDWEGRQAEYM